MVIIRALILCTLTLAAPAATGARVELTLRVPFDALREALAAQLAASPAGPNVVYREGACRYLRVEAPEVEGRDGNLQLTAPGSAALGLEMPGGCAGAAAWRGSMALTAVPQLDAAGRLRLRIVDSRLVDSPGGGAPLAFVWELAKPQVHARLEAFALDIGPLRAALAQLVQSTAPPREAAALGQVLAGLELRPPRVEAAGVLVPLALEVPDAWVAAPPPAPPAAPLTEAELEALDLALQPWDAFLAYVVKQIALENGDPALRQRLFTLLLDSRYRLSRILSGEETAPGDPLRALFLEAWAELRAMPELARHVAFIDAGEALLALDRALPGLGAQLSADGLRQMARRLRPADPADPVAFDWTVDGELRTLFDVEELPAAPPAPRRSLLDLFIASAHAREMRALDTWVPRRNELDDYQGRIDALLRETSVAELQRGAIGAPYDAVYRHLVPATALIESCWRQYVVRGGKVRYLRSSASSVGIMQINERVWRGFYDIKRLRWDTAYNARAGARILLRYLKDYAVPYAERSGNPDDAPRAAYAVYNAGPRAVGRFAKQPPHPREKRVDDRLWTLYQGVASGGQADLRSCGVVSATAAQ